MAQINSLHSEESRRLLDTIDQLRLLPSINHEVELPQIVVVGQQSSGKSSVLKALSGIDFPTNSGLCTQFATEIICRRDPVECTKVSIVPSVILDPPHQQRLDNFSQRWNDRASTEDIEEIVDNAAHAMGLNDHRRISKDKLRFEFSGPTQDHLSLIDLPGLFEQHMPRQRETDKKLVDEMVTEYIRGDQTIVLAIVSGNSDIQVQRICGMFEPYRARTLGVVTAPDKVENSTARAATFSQLVSNTSFYAGLGWHVVRNLSLGEEQEGLSRDQVEKDFFEACSTSPESVWSKVPDSRVGIRNLKSKLGKLLQANISEGLPRIQMQLREACHRSELELSLLGEERRTVEQQREYLAEKSEMLRQQVVRALDGEHSGTSLRASIRNANDRFAEHMTKFGRSWDFIGNDEKTPEVGGQDHTRLGDMKPRVMREQEWLKIMSEEISNSRGRELNGLLEPVWVGRMFLRQSRKWKSLVELHVEESLSIVESFFDNIMESVVGAESAGRFLTYAIRPELERRQNALREKVAEILTPYSTEHIRTLNRDFKRSDLQRDNRKSWNHDMILFFTCRMIDFYGIALNVFLDNIESLAIENVLLAGLEDIMTAVKSHKLSDEQVSLLASESEDIYGNRARLQAMIQEYKEGSKIILRYSARSSAALPSGQTWNSNIPYITPQRATITVTAPASDTDGDGSSTAHLASGSETSDYSRRSSESRAHSQGLSPAGSSRRRSVTSSETSEERPLSGASSVHSTPSRLRTQRSNRFEAGESGVGIGETLHSGH